MQNYGVKNATPEYKSVYNYFDFQYEPSVVKAISSNLIQESSLPSVYDFLYLSKQFDTLSTFLHVNENISLENFSLGNLNEYLNEISDLYSDYLSDATDLGDDIVDPAGEEIVPKFLEKNLFDFQYPTVEQNSYNTPIAAMFDTNKNKFLKEIASSKQFSKKAKLSKENFIPIWLNDVKRGVYFSEKSIETFNQAEQFKINFPFYMDINIPTEGMGPIAKLLTEVDLLDSINTHAASLTAPVDSANEFGILENLKAFDPSYDSPETVGSFYGGMLNGNDNQLFNLFENVKLKTFRMYFTNSPQNSLQDDPFKYSQSQVGSVQGQDASSLNPFIAPLDIFLDTFQDIGLESPKNVFTYSENENKIASSFANILKQIQGNKFTNSIKKLFIDGKLLRTPAEIQQGKLAHQETLMYEIAKYDDSNNYIQSIFIPISKLDNINYLDTQVVPYKNYYYKIFAHKVIVGTKYRMAPFIPNEEGEYIEAVITDQNLYKHQYWVQPYLEFVRVPYYNVPLVNVTTDSLNFSRIEDAPPLAPQVQIIPYKGINNKLLFLFNNSIGESLQRAVPIFETDNDLFAAISISQQKASGKLLFKGDDPLDSVQIFRTDNVLSNYTDIVNDPTSFIDFVRTEDASSTSYVDTIKPNKDYYYFFRGIDIHGKISNPTSIYKVRMVSDINSAPYLKTELFSFKQPEKLIDSKTFQKYLLFEPSSEQNTVNYSNLVRNFDEQALGNYETQEVTLGPQGISSVFGNKYKLRITSKQTGRKIDVNVTLKEPKNIINDI